jgi:hypothetical protein
MELHEVTGEKSDLLVDSTFRLDGKQITPLKNSKQTTKTQCMVVNESRYTEDYFLPM